ncbi:hypothetical protein ACFQ0B_12750 [Nonomuraea thailandensis]
MTLSYDSSLFTGTPRAAGWKPNYIPDGEVAPVHALTMDVGRQDPRFRSPRVPDPPRYAADAFARLLTKQGIKVAKSVRQAKAPPARPSWAGSTPRPSTPSSSTPSPTATTTWPRP